MKKFITAAIALSLLSGGAYSKPAQANEPAKAEGEAAGPSFIEMKPLVLPLVDKEGVSQIISIVISLETDDPANVAQIELMRPRLTDAYIQGMYGVLGSKDVMSEGILQVGYIKDRLHTITNKIMGENKVKDVLLQVVQQRRV